MNGVQCDKLSMNMGTFSNFCCPFEKPSFMQWDSDLLPLQSKRQHTLTAYKNLCFLSVIFAFSVGLTIGILIPLLYFETAVNKNQTDVNLNNFNNNTAEIKIVFFNNSYAFKSTNNYPSVSFLENPASHGNSFVDNGIYWGRKIEQTLPVGYNDKKRDIWEKYVQKAVAIKMESGCGRMQNRLVTFQDGLKACVRYRQNIDQIQGELFSFYLAKILNLPNLVPSTVSIVDTDKPLWQNLRNEIASAQWNSNKPLILTQYIPNLNNANIPAIFRPMDRHLNKYDVLNVTGDFAEERNLLDKLIELAQWSDLIIFDYLTANLDRIVNNLYNYQWNSNIMDAPAHNLARKSDSNLLVFLDNESGLLHGYRLLKKYEIYHSLLLENLCMFKQETAARIKQLKVNRNVGFLLREMFENQNSDKIKEILPTLPDKSIKILNERIDKVYSQISRCETIFSNS